MSIKRKIFWAVTAAIVFSTGLLVAQTITKGYIGKQDFSLWDGTSTKTFTRENSSGFNLTLNQVDWPGVDVLQVYGAGASRSHTTLQAAITATSASRTPLWLSPGTWTIGANTTFGALATPVLPPGAIFSVSSGYTLTFTSPYISAGDYQIFSGAGSIAFAEGTELRSSWFASLSAAVSYIGSVNVTLDIDHAETISADLTVPRNINLRIRKGCPLTVATTKTLTVSGGIDAGLYRIFTLSGTGRVLFGDGSIAAIFPEWWGALADASTDNSTALQAILTASMNSTFRPPILFQPGIYSHATGLTITYPQGMTLKGATGGYYTPQAAGYTSKVTTLHYTGSGNGLVLGDGSSNGTGFVCKNIYFKGTSSALGGVILNLVSGLVFKDCTFGQYTKSGAYGFYQSNGQTNSFYNCSFINNYYGTSLGQGDAENSTTRFYDCVWHSNTNHALKIEHAIGSIVLYSPLFQDNAGSAIFADGTIGPKPVNGLKIYGGYIAGSNASVSGVAIDIRGSNDGGAGSWAKGVVLSDLYFATPGASQIASIRLRNTDGPVIDNIVFGSIAPDEIIAADSDNNKLRIGNWKYASTYIKDASGGNVVYWNKQLVDDEHQRVFRGGDVLIHQEDAAGAVPVLTLQQADVSEPFIKFAGSSAGSAGESISSWKTGATLQGYVQVNLNGEIRWMPFYSAPSGP